MALWPNKRQSAFNQAASNAGNAVASQAYDPHRFMQDQLMRQYLAAAGLGSSALGRSEPKHKPSTKYPNTLGWRSWVWDMVANELRSPMHGTVWTGPELRCETWDESQVVRGSAGIHAHLVPDDWHKLVMDEAPQGGRAWAEQRDGEFRACIAIQGIAERFGKFALGSEGWRAEWVIIRQLAAPTDEIGLALEKAFPDVEIIYGNR